MDILDSAGPWLYPLGLNALGLLLAVGRSAVVIRADDPPPPYGPPHQAVVVWGVLGAVVGVMGTVVGAAGLAQGLRGIVGSGPVDAQRMLQVLEEGAVVVASPAALGLALLALSLVCWLALDFALSRRASASA